MNGLTKIGKAALEFGISSRTLRYWESAGLFVSTRDAQSGWRVFDEQALERIRVTDLLRRLDFSIRDIKEILDKQTVDTLCSVLRKQRNRLTKAGADLDARREAITELIAILEAEASISLSSLENILSPVALDRKKHVLTKLTGGFKMDDLKSKYGDVCIVNLPPMHTAAYQCVSTEPEKDSVEVVQKWLAENRLEGTARLFGFNTEPYAPTQENPGYGFGFCATVPEGFPICEPMYAKELPGGLYAVISEYDDDMFACWNRIMALFEEREWGWAWVSDRHPLEEHIARADGKGDFYMRIHVPVAKKEPKSP